MLIIWIRMLLLGACILPAAGCAPTLQLLAPDEPITINLNVTVEHEVRAIIDG